jgi:hypothetical protein
MIAFSMAYKLIKVPYLVVLQTPILFRFASFSLLKNVKILKYNEKYENLRFENIKNSINKRVMLFKYEKIE